MNLNPIPTYNTTAPQKVGELWSSAQKLEAVFLSEMLKHSGFGKPLEGFGGGIGEEQFSSLMIEHQAQALAKNGGVGLAEQIFQSMAKQYE